jgi:hypothetical protein
MNPSNSAVAINPVNPDRQSRTAAIEYDMNRGI